MIKYNNTEIDKVIYNGTEVDKVTYNGVTVFEKTPSTVTHKLIFANDVSVTVNGSSVTSPYNLQNGDTIVLSRPSGYQSFLIVAGSESWDSDSTIQPLSISNSDINIYDGEVSKSPSANGFTINYSETSSTSETWVLNSSIVSAINQTNVNFTTKKTVP